VMPFLFRKGVSTALMQCPPTPTHARTHTHTRSADDGKKQRFNNTDVQCRAVSWAISVPRMHLLTPTPPQPVYLASLTI